MEALRARTAAQVPAEPAAAAPAAAPATDAPAAPAGNPPSQQDGAAQVRGTKQFSKGCRLGNDRFWKVCGSWLGQSPLAAAQAYRELLLL